jgi:erythromycin esterase-like protein
MSNTEQNQIEIVNRSISVLRGSQDYDRFLDAIGDAHFVLIGEASHGTHEFYKHRAEITKRLIVEKGFQAVAAEADWPDAPRVNQYVRGRGKNKSPEDALSGFGRFPSWMWRDEVVADFTGWLRNFNQDPARKHEASFYGLD